MQFHDTAGKAFILYKTDDTSCTRMLVTRPLTTQYPLTHTHHFTAASLLHSPGKSYQLQQPSLRGSSGNDFEVERKGGPLLTKVWSPHFSRNSSS